MLLPYAASAWLISKNFAVKPLKESWNRRWLNFSALFFNIYWMLLYYSVRIRPRIYKTLLSKKVITHYGFSRSLCYDMALDIRNNTYNQNLPQFFHENIDSTGKIY